MRLRQTSPTRKPIVWRQVEINTPPMSLEARVEAGHLLARLRNGENLALPRSRPMPSIGQHVHELRINDEHETWRIIYRIDADAIVVVEIFSKRTPQTPLDAIRRSQNRLARYDEERAEAQRKLRQNHG